MKPHPEVVKAYKKMLDADHKASDYNYGANKARVTRAYNTVAKIINKHHPNLSQQDKINLYTKLGNMVKENKENFKPHMMYDPKTGKAYKAEKPEDHERMSKMGYTHEKPKVEEDTTTANIPNPAVTSQGPVVAFLDRRSKKKKKLLKKFREYNREMGIE